MSTVHILLNKDRYIEFSVPAPKQKLEYLRLLFGPKINAFDKASKFRCSSFSANKSMLPHVQRVLKLKGFDTKVKEDWI